MLRSAYPLIYEWGLLSMEATLCGEGHDIGMGPGVLDSRAWLWNFFFVL
jgi:hypothetical protein